MHTLAPSVAPLGLADAVMAQLRAATRTHHQRIEQLLALDAPMPLSRYAAILQGFQSLLTGLEAELREALPVGMHGWLAARSRLGFLAQDLAWLGRAVPPSLPGAGLRCLPQAGVPSAFGALYVIEGSALGGQVIVPRLQRDMGLEPGRGASYFHGFGDRTGSMWREFRQRAGEAIGSGAMDRQQACRAAGQTFDALTSAFEKALS